MGLIKPYYRIIRPFSLDDVEDYCENWENIFMIDKRYSDDRLEICRSYKIIEKDLLQLFEYIEPTDSNLSIYSHKIYGLLLRASTEFETNSKRILEANGYTKCKNLEIRDYFKINKASRLCDYSIVLDFWNPNKKILHPFKEWNNGHSLSWYQAYNSVKHDRNKNFNKASLENTLNAIAGLFAILFSQFFLFIDPYKITNGFSINDENFIFTDNILFGIKPSTNWEPDEIYDFKWKDIKDDSAPFEKFSF